MVTIKMRKGTKHTPEARLKLSIAMKKSGRLPPSRNGTRTSEETKKKISEKIKLLGIVPPSALGLKRSDAFKRKVKENHSHHWLGKKQTKETIEKRVSKFRGELSPMWKGGITTENNKIRTSVKYKRWVESVYVRDGYTCQKYGTIGGKLIAHHIINFSSSPELRFDLSNGITLSQKAHKEFHRKYGVKNNNITQLLEFLEKI